MKDTEIRRKPTVREQVYVKMETGRSHVFFKDSAWPKVMLSNELHVEAVSWSTSWRSWISVAAIRLVTLRSSIHSVRKKRLNIEQKLGLQ